MADQLKPPVASANPAYAKIQGLQEKALDHDEYFEGKIYTSRREHWSGLPISL
jgi:hypothetical protein